MIRFRPRRAAIRSWRNMENVCTLGTNISSFSIPYVSFSFSPFFFSFLLSLSPAESSLSFLSSLHRPSVIPAGGTAGISSRANRFPRWHVQGLQYVLKPVISRCRKFIAVDYFPAILVLGVAMRGERTLYSFLDPRCSPQA